MSFAGVISNTRLDHETGEPVLKHLQEIASDAVLLSQTLSRWSENAQGNIMRSVPPAATRGNGGRPAWAPLRSTSKRFHR